jgi:hypothetical protein
MLVDPATPYFFLKELGPHLHLVTLDIAVDVVLAEDTAALILLEGSVAHSWRGELRVLIYNSDVDVKYLEKR